MHRRLLLVKLRRLLQLGIRREIVLNPQLRPGCFQKLFDGRSGGRLTAVNTATGDFAWQIPLGITEGLPEAKQNTGRPALAGAIVTGRGVLFVGSTDDNRFRAIEAKTGKQLWVTKLDRRANADPITYQGKDGKQYVAIVATDTLVAFALP